MKQAFTSTLSEWKFSLVLNEESNKLHYEPGNKPGRPDFTLASFSGGVLTVDIAENGDILPITSKVSLPEGDDHNGITPFVCDREHRL